MKDLRGFTAHVHLSDCDANKYGDLPPGRGMLDFPRYLKATADTGFKRPVSIELEYSPGSEKILDWVREACQSTNALMSELNLRSRRARRAGMRTTGEGKNSSRLWAERLIPLPFRASFFWVRRVLYGPGSAERGRAPRL